MKQNAWPRNGPESLYKLNSPKLPTLRTEKEKDRYVFRCIRHTVAPCFIFKFGLSCRKLLATFLSSWLAPSVTTGQVPSGWLPFPYTPPQPPLLQIKPVWLISWLTFLEMHVLWKAGGIPLCTSSYALLHDQDIFWLCFLLCWISCPFLIEYQWLRDVLCLTMETMGWALLRTTWGDWATPKYLP